jgi:hypothetical protein
MNLFRNAVIPSSGRAKSPPAIAPPRSGTSILSNMPAFSLLNWLLLQEVAHPQTTDHTKAPEADVAAGAIERSVRCWLPRYRDLSLRNIETRKVR